jgi:hypothetical protein
MAKNKTFWDEIKNDGFWLYGGTQGWEVHFTLEETVTIDHKTGKSKRKKSLQPQWPFGYGDGVSREEKALCRKEVMQKHKQRKMLAQASRNEAEYRDLHLRVDSERWENILATGITGLALGNYIRATYLTEREGYALFWNM